MITPTLLQVFVSALGHMANKEAPQIQMMSNYLQNNMKLRRLCHIFFCK